jgi:hypothetical protein
MGKLEKAKRLAQRGTATDNDDIYINMYDAQKEGLHQLSYKASALSDVSNYNDAMAFDYPAMEQAVLIALGEYDNGEWNLDLKDDNTLGTALLLILAKTFVSIDKALRDVMIEKKHNTYTIIKDNNSDDGKVFFFGSAHCANDTDAFDNGKAIAFMYSETSKSI